MSMTSAEFAALERKVAGNFKKPVEVAPGKGVEREADLHEQIFAECRRRGWIPLHGAMSERTHRTAGEPDFVILAEKDLSGFDEDGIEHSKFEPCIYLVECKTRTGKLSPAQTALHHHANKLGHTVHVVRSMEEFLKLI